MRKILQLFLVGTLGLVLGACVRNDDEPLIPSAPISRLYVSLLEFQTDETADPYSNLLVIDPANGEQAAGSLFNSGVREGSGVFFSPEVSRVFQGSVLDQSIILMNVTDVGIPQRSGQLRNEDLTAIRGLHYHHGSRNLFVANNWTPSGIYVFDNPLNRNGDVEPLRYFPLGGVRPWGITMWDDNLLVVRTGVSGGVNLYTNMSSKLEGTEDLSPQAVLTVAGADALRGIAYSEILDLLVLTEFEKGQILIFENASQLFSGGSDVITPTRVISGSNTGLAGPIDVAIDDRAGGQMLYVADKPSKSILRFNLEAQGNTSPLFQTRLPLTPESLFLDARGLAGDE
ncbi:MAG TPA: hypothetical protein VKZ78_02750 [Sphingobacteriaceae bacterium]|nr:hypothetical protein [Sphingobacteriaceae bacterium]